MAKPNDNGEEGCLMRDRHAKRDLPPDTEYLSFRTSPIHGLGAFARVDIPKATRIIEYVGEKIDKMESLRRCEDENTFVFSLNELEDLDGNVEWNLARFINHSCEPNCEAEFAEGHIWLVAIRDIRASEEITFNYGYDLTDYREHPCHCGAVRCVGYIVGEEFFDVLRKKAG